MAARKRGHECPHQLPCHFTAEVNAEKPILPALCNLLPASGDSEWLLQIVCVLNLTDQRWIINFDVRITYPTYIRLVLRRHQACDLSLSPLSRSLSPHAHVEVQEQRI